MKKKISVLGLVLLLILSLAGCSNKSAAEETTYDQAAMEQYAQAILVGFSNMDSTITEQYRDMSDMELELMLMQTGLPISGKDFLSMLDAWEAGEKECGEFVEYDSFKMETSNDGAVLSTNVKYQDRDAVIEFAFDEKMNMESLTVNAKYPLGEILTKAGLNTILGMGTVFTVLIFISFIIYLFKYIQPVQERISRVMAPVVLSVKSLFSKNKPEAPAHSPTPVTAPVVAQTDDSELIAVIAAAIAAAEGTTTDGFVVRSIKRRTSNKWN